MRRRTLISITLVSLLLVSIPTLALDDPELTVVINEICWAGAAWDHTAEWIELFNTTDLPIDLEGWQLISSDGAPHIRLHGIIQPHVSDVAASGYFLLERGSDKSVPEVMADLVYQGALSDLGEMLALIDSNGRIVDTVNASPAADSLLAWPAGSDNRGAPPFASMERVRFQLADEPVNWASYAASVPEDSAQYVLGTPNAENSVYNALPIAQLIITPVSPHPGVPAEFNAEGSNDPNDPIVSYHWEFGDGTEASGSVVSHTYPEEGRYTITLILTDSKGGQARLTRDVHVALTTKPVADFSLILKSDREVARAGDLLMFQDESSDADSEIISWKWYFGDGNEATGQRVSHSYEAYGEYDIRLHVMDTQGEVGIQTRSLSIASRLPVVVFTFSPERPNQFETVYFDASESFDPDGEIVSYQWDFDGDGVIDTETSEPTAEYEYDSGGLVSSRVYAVNDLSERAMRERTIDVNATPVAQFQISSFEPLELELVTLTDLSHDSDGTIVQWSWDFGDGTISDEASPSHIYQQNGVTEIILTVTDELGAVGTAVATIDVVNLSPVVSLTVPEATRPTGSTFFFDASGSYDPSPQGSLTRFEWCLGEGEGFEFETSVASLAHAFTDDGQLTIRVRVTDSGGATVISEPFTITVTNRAPTVSGVTWSPIDPSDIDDVLFTVNSSDPDGEITGWTWNLESGAMGSSQEFEHAFHDDGSYLLTIQVRDNDGASSDTYSVMVPILNTPPVAAFTATQTSTCDVGGMQFDASESYDPSPTGRIVHVAWDFGDGTNCPGSSADCSDAERLTPEHCYSEPGTYIVTLVAIDERGAISSTQKTIFIGE